MLPGPLHDGLYHELTVPAQRPDFHQQLNAETAKRPDTLTQFGDDALAKHQYQRHQA